MLVVVALLLLLARGLSGAVSTHADLVVPTHTCSEASQKLELTEESTPTGEQSKQPENQEGLDEIRLVGGKKTDDSRPVAPAVDAPSPNFSFEMIGVSIREIERRRIWIREALAVAHNVDLQNIHLHTWEITTGICELSYMLTSLTREAITTSVYQAENDVPLFEQALRFLLASRANIFCTVQNFEVDRFYTMWTQERVAFDNSGEPTAPEFTRCETPCKTWKRAHHRDGAKSYCNVGHKWGWCGPKRVGPLGSEDKKPPHDLAEKYRVKNTKFRTRLVNLYGEPLRLWYVDGKKSLKDGVAFDVVAHGQSTPMDTFNGHYFAWTRPADQERTEIYGHTVRWGVTTYTVPHKDDVKEEALFFKYERTKFFDEYKKRTGRNWVAFWPKEKPSVHFYNAEKAGDIFKIESPFPHYNLCPGKTTPVIDETQRLKWQQGDTFEFFNQTSGVMLPLAKHGNFPGWFTAFMAAPVENSTDMWVQTTSNYHARKNYNEWVSSPSTAALNHSLFLRVSRDSDLLRPLAPIEPEEIMCRDKAPMTFELKATLAFDHTNPRLFEIHNFLSPFETSHILKISKHQGFYRSVVVNDGDGIIPERTSATAWVKRQSSVVVDNLANRIANLFRINENRLNMNTSSEDFQCLHYGNQQYYTHHHDYGIEADNIGASRAITFLMYLNTPEEGGGTTMSRALNGKGATIKAEAGKVAFFYDVMPDGNNDENTYHQGDHVIKGEKFSCPLWIWDPFIHI